jgi:hypothetical protein
MSKAWAGAEVRRAFEPFLTEEGDAVDMDLVLAAAGRAEHSGEAVSAPVTDRPDIEDMSRADLVALVRHHHSWAGLMDLLDEHWPEDVFPTVPDREDRDPGARIVSLLRWLDAERAGDATVTSRQP